MSDEFRVGSACSGVGGFDLGLERAGMRVAWQCEADEKCRAVLARHWPKVPCHPDLRTLAVCEQPAMGGERDGGQSSPVFSGGRPDPSTLSVDLLCGGTPCQDLSIAGLRAGIERGERSSLFFDFARVASVVLGPGGWLLFENVDGLLSSNRGRDFAIVLATLAELGFHDLAWRVLNSRYFGVPQRRRRIFILARRASGRCAAEVLLEPESGGGDHQAGGKEGPRVAATLSRGSSRPGVSVPGRRQEDDQNIVATLQRKGDRLDAEGAAGGHIVNALDTNAGGPDDNSAQAGHIVGPLMARSNQFNKEEVDGGHFVPVEVGALTAEGHDASEDGTGRQAIVAPINPDRARETPELSRRLDGPVRPLACPAEPRPDGPREQQMGNAVTVSVAQWLGERILAHEEAKAGSQ